MRVRGTGAAPVSDAGTSGTEEAWEARGAAFGARSLLCEHPTCRAVPGGTCEGPWGQAWDLEGLPCPLLPSAGGEGQAWALAFLACWPGPGPLPTDRMTWPASRWQLAMGVHGRHSQSGVQMTVPLCGKGHCAKWARMRY